MVATAAPKLTPENARAEQLTRSALDHVWIHFAPWSELTEYRGMKVFERGDGALLYDAFGTEYIDGIAGLFVVNAGHGRAEIAEAMAAQARQLAYVSSGNYTTTPAAILAETIAGLLPGDLDRVYFCSGGSEAVESAVKIAKQVQVMRGFPNRYKIVARIGSYHGATHGVMSLSHNTGKYFGPPMPGVVHVPSPNNYRPNFAGLEGEADDVACADFVEKVIQFEGPETVAAVVAEPVPSSNGVHVPSPRYWQRLREVCDTHGVLLIADEVLDGWGRTGTLFAIEQMGIVPDLLTMAKGLASGYVPIAAVAVRESVYDIFKDNPDEHLIHLLTFGGHAVAAAAALKNIEIFEREDLVAQSRDKGAYLLDQFRGLTNHPTVGQVRGLGLLCGVEIVKSKTTKENFGKEHPFTKRVNHLIDEKGLLNRVWETIFYGPPLVITRDEIDRMVAITDEALTIAEGEFAVEIES